MSKVEVKVMVEADGKPIAEPITSAANTTASDRRKTIGELCDIVAIGLRRNCQQIANGRAEPDA